MELKTLKEIELETPIGTRASTFESIRKEAGKWVASDQWNDDTDEYGNVRAWIIHFFNLMDEEIKEKQ